MECVIDFKVLHGEQNEIVKEVSVAAENVIETFHFKSPYPMSAHSSHVCFQEVGRYSRTMKVYV